MNKDEYIIVNKSVLQKRIEELKNYFKEKQLSNIESVAFNHSILELKEILSQSIDLIPVLEDAFNKGGAYTLGSHKDFKQIHPNKQEYISNLKLDI